MGSPDLMYVGCLMLYYRPPTPGNRMEAEDAIQVDRRIHFSTDWLICSTLDFGNILCNSQYKCRYLSSVIVDIKNTSAQVGISFGNCNSQKMLKKETFCL